VIGRRLPVRRTLLALKIVVTVALLGAVLAAADLPALGRLLRAVSPAFFSLAVAALLLQTLVLAVRLHAIVAAIGRPIGAGAAIELSFVGALFNQALPSAIGGDAIRAWRLRADGRPWRSAVNAVLLDRGGGVLVLAVLAAFAVVVEPSGVFAPLRLVLWAVVVAGLMGLAAIAAADRLPLLPRAARRLLTSSGLPPAARTVFATRVAPLAGTLSAASHLLAALAAYWLAAALGVELAFGTFVTAALCMLLATMVPLSYAGWGIREAGAVWLLARAGVPTETALAISVLFGAALFVASLPGLTFWFAPIADRETPAPPALH
jgi:glycosyltransferase 2 family protein